MIRWNGIVPMHNVAELAGPDALDHKQVDADRRRDLAHLDEQHQDDAEPDRIDAVLQQHRIQQRHRDHDHAEAFDQAAQHGVEHEQRKEELELRQFQIDQKLGDLFADAGIADRVGEQEGGVDDEQDIAAHPDRGLQGAPRASRRLNSPQNTAMIIASTQPTAAASVGVTSPV